MLKIQVLGQGLIPRGLGLAPRKEPFFADYNTIASIITDYQNFTVNMVGKDGKLTELTTSNIKRVWDSEVNKIKEEPKQETKKVEEKKPQVEAKKEEYESQPKKHDKQQQNTPVENNDIKGKKDK